MGKIDSQLSAKSKLKNTLYWEPFRENFLKKTIVSFKFSYFVRMNFRLWAKVFRRDGYNSTVITCLEVHFEEKFWTCNLFGFWAKIFRTLNKKHSPWLSKLHCTCVWKNVHGHQTWQITEKEVHIMREWFSFRNIITTEKNKAENWCDKTFRRKLIHSSLHKLKLLRVLWKERTKSLWVQHLETDRNNFDWIQSSFCSKPCCCDGGAGFSIPSTLLVTTSNAHFEQQMS